MGKAQSGGGEVMDYAVVYFSPADFSVALDVANRHGGCAMFCRNGQVGVHAGALKAKTVYTVGGPALGVAGEVYLAGDAAIGTLVAVAEAYKAGRI